MRLIVAAVVLSWLVVPVPARAQAPGVGAVSFSNSGKPEAQEAFLTGLAQLHNFEYADAAQWFRRAQTLDAGFALAYWGEAMTFNHPVWMEQDIASARRALARLAPSADQRLAMAPTAREKAYLQAVETLYGAGDKYARDVKYAEAMADLHRAYPDDVEATAFYALSLLGTAHEGRDVAVYMRAAALLEPLFVTHPRHPGVAHYLIHSFDDPAHAPLGLRAAQAYSTIAPSAAHAQHMCSHIFLAMGMWDDLVTANQTAVGLVDRARAARGQPAGACGHYPSWLEYGYLQQGRVNAAKQLVGACRTRARGDGSALAPEKLAIDSFVTMRARFLLDTEDWGGEVAGWSVPLNDDDPQAAVLTAFIDGFGAVRTGRGDAAAALARLRSARSALDARMQSAPPPDGSANSARGWASILELELSAMIDARSGNGGAAIATLRKAAALEDALPYEFGPPFIDKPTYELLGEALLADGRFADAAAAFDKALARTPERTTALMGLMRASEKMGESAKAAAVKSRLRTIWHAADAVPSELGIAAR